MASISRVFANRFLIVSLLAISSVGCESVSDIPIVTGYSAKYICSGLFVSGFDLDKLKQDFVAPTVTPLDTNWTVSVDHYNKSVTVGTKQFNGRYANTAHYREGLGCTLVHDENINTLDQQKPALLPKRIISQQPWPSGDGPISADIPDLDYSAVNAAIKRSFIESDPNNPINTLAVAVVHQNKLIAEHYAEGVNNTTRLAGWSMTKSLSSALVGILYGLQSFDITKPAPVPEWQGTEKEAITTADLLHMAAGLDWNEEPTGENPDQGNLLHATDFASYYIDKPLVARPGTVFNYSTGSSSLLGRIVQDQIGGDVRRTSQFVNAVLFRPLGISDAILEFDTIGQPALGSYLYMSARDWARLGLLYLRQGDWFGNQVISKEWVNFSTTPSATNPNYGSQMWLNTHRKLWSQLPESTFAFLGYQGQFVIIIPEYDLVFVRLGVTFDTANKSPGYDLQNVILDIVAALPQY